MVGSDGFTGNFVVSEVTFDDQRWFELNPEKVVVKLEVNNPDLSRVTKSVTSISCPAADTGLPMIQRLVD